MFFLAAHPAPSLALTNSFVGSAEVRAAERAEPDACTVRLANEDDGRGWKAAVVEAESRVRALPAEAHDCKSVEVHVAIDGAVVVFTTRDGRQAVRQVATPAELAATVEALLVTS